jgi:hypothetical protein
VNFTLHPFLSTESVPPIEIVGKIDRQKNFLHLDYQLLGNLQDILIATSSDSPTRKDELWRETCFEFFLGIPNSSQYWEFNLSPSGHWNVYHFEDYRQGMQNESRLTDLPFKVDRKLESFTLSLEVDLDRLRLARPRLEIAITAVVKQTNKTITYWALTHQGSQPDFHLRESFILEI